MTDPNFRIMVTNDDGIHAPGLTVLEEIARELSEDVWISAPASEQSGASRKMTFTEPILVTRHDKQRFSVRGTPSDACFLGLHDLLPGPPPDLVLSGVNRGQNLADDIGVSGTVAAAIQAMKMGVPAIALSQTLTGFTGVSETAFDCARAHGAGLVRRLLAAKWGKHVVLNVNFPPCAPDEVKGIQVTRQGERDQWRMHADKRTDLRGRTYYWLGFEGGLSNPDEGDDLHAIYNNYISITPVSIELTHEASLGDLAAALSADASA